MPVREEELAHLLRPDVVEGRQFADVDAGVQPQVAAQFAQGRLDVHLGREGPHLEAVGVLAGGNIRSLCRGGTGTADEDAVVIGNVGADELGTRVHDQFLVSLLPAVDLGQLGGVALPHDFGDAVLDDGGIGQEVWTDVAQYRQQGQDAIVLSTKLIGVR